MQRQAQGSEGRALGAEQTVAALQQDLASWQGRYKKKDCELASQTSKVHTDCLKCLCCMVAVCNTPRRVLQSFQLDPRTKIIVT